MNIIFIRLNINVFMCFFLGNDFLPGFISLNIRTHGLQVLLDTYRKYMGSYYNRYFVSKETGKIVWKNVKLFVGEIAKIEYELLLKEENNRNRFDGYYFPETTKEEVKKKYENMPIIDRRVERYVNIREKGWELRYERECLKGELMSNVSERYKEGIVWVYRYYKGDRVERRWKYGKEYGPTMKELYKVIKENMEEEEVEEEEEISKEENLNRIMPSANEGPKEFIWAYKRYMWEAGIL